MNLKELEKELLKMGVNSRLFSLNGNILPDRIIVDKCDSSECWLVYYYDEKGKSNNVKKFYSENDVSEYVYNLFSEYMKNT